MTTRPRSVLLVAANAVGALTGNERTTLRIAALLRGDGIGVHVERPDVPAPSGVAPDVVHAFHVRRSGPRALAVGEARGAPVVVSVTGTDLGVDLHVPERAATIRDVLGRVHGVACGNDDEARVAATLARPGVPVVVVPKGVAPLAPCAPAPAAAGPGPLVLAVAHVRRVKRLDVALLALRHLRIGGSDARLAIVGEVLDPEEEARLSRLAGEDEWRAVFRGPVRPEDVPAWLAAADVVLNTSDVEGGSNAVLEAMAAGRAVVASDVPGNAQVVGRDGARGLLYDVTRHGAGEGGRPVVIHGVASCAAALGRLLRDPDLRRRTGAAARAFVLREHAPARERAALLDLYARVLART